MTGSGGTLGRRPLAPRLALFVAVGAAHLLAIWLMLSSGGMAGVVPTHSDLVLFDVVEPPPPLPAPPPPAIAEPGGGGSPGKRRERPAPMREVPAPPRREAMDLTQVAAAPPAVMPAVADGTATFDLGRGGNDNVGTGSGAGIGAGDGRGSGGTTKGEAFARAVWVERPPQDVALRHWPVGQERLAHTVLVQLRCKVRRSGRTYGCRVTSESPPRLGFGGTALAMLQMARVRPVARNGEPLWGVPVLVTISFDALDTAPRLPG